jgi:hypothetical protein
VHGDVDATYEERLLQFLDEDAAASDLAERPRPVAVACGRDRDQRDLETRPAQRIRSALGLGQRQPATARADAKQHSCGG